MAKIGIKEKKTTKYSLAITGRVVIKNDKVYVDTSEVLDESELTEVETYLKNLIGEVVDVKVNQTEEEEL